MSAENYNIRKDEIDSTSCQYLNKIVEYWYRFSMKNKSEVFHVLLLFWQKIDDENILMRQVNEITKRE